jgi:hypothetical protein
MNKENFKYTQTEIDSHINILENQIDELKRERTHVSKLINNKKKDVVKWREFDISQLKLL